MAMLGSYDCTEDQDNPHTGCVWAALIWILVLIGVIIFLLYVVLGICAMIILYNFYTNLKNREKITDTPTINHEGGMKNELH